MKKQTVNITINFSLPEKADVERAVLKVADFTESLCATVPSKAKSKINGIKERMPSTKEEFVATVKEKTPETAKKLANTAKEKAESAKAVAKEKAACVENKAKALKEATIEAGRMIGSAFAETVALFADTAATSVAIFADTIKTIAGKNDDDFCDCCECCECDCPEECECDGDCDSCGCEEDGDDGEDGEDDLTEGQLACNVPQPQSEYTFAKYLADQAFIHLCKGCELARNAARQIKMDITLIRERDPAASGSLEVLFLYSGLHAVMAHRVAHFLHQKGFNVTARAISQITKTVTGIEIHPGATIGKGLFIDHGTGVVIGETAIIGDNCTIYQGVTLGGTGKQTGKRHPTLLDGVMVGAGAKVLGPVVIGNNSKIAAGAVVLSDIPDHSTAVGIPARVVKCNNIRVDELDQVHIPDPISQELCKLNIRLEAAERELSLIKEVKNEAL